MPSDDVIDETAPAARTDEEFLIAFESATLPRPEWTHAAHLRMAYLYLRGGESWQSVLPFVRERITAYNLSNGNRTGYHETITASLLRIAALRLRESPADTFTAFRSMNPDLFEDGLAVLGRHYSCDVLLSAAARAGFLPPDRDPLPD